MSNSRILIACLFLALVSTVGLAADSVRPVGVSDPTASVFDKYDPSGSIRLDLGEEFADANLAWLRANIAPADTAEATIQLAVAAAFDLQWDPDRQGDEQQAAVGEWAMLAAAQVATDLFPEVGGLHDIGPGPFDPTPIESFCGCVSRSARACGCIVSHFGLGACQFTVECGWGFSGVCHNAVAIQMCAVENAVDIVSPIRR